MNKRLSMERLFQQVSQELKKQMAHDISMRDVEYINVLGAMAAIFWDRIKDDYPEEVSEKAKEI